MFIALIGGIIFKGGDAECEETDFSHRKKDVLWIFHQLMFITIFLVTSILMSLSKFIFELYYYLLTGHNKTRFQSSEYKHSLKWL